MDLNQISCWLIIVVNIGGESGVFLSTPFEATMGHYGDRDGRGSITYVRGSRGVRFLELFRIMELGRKRCCKLA